MFHQVFFGAALNPIGRKQSNRYPLLPDYLLILNPYVMKFSFLLFLLLPIYAGAQPDSRKLDRWLDANTPQMGGRATLVIFKDGKLVYNRSVNQLSVRQKLAGRVAARRLGKDFDNEDYSATTRVPIASCSKWLSAALVMTFVDEGKLSLDDTVGRFLPVMSKHGKGNITISQCLSHLTGIKAPALKESLDDTKSAQSMDEAIEQIAVLPMEGRPGTVFRYSNAGLQIAAAVIEKIAGKNFEALFAERIARPLHMKNTDFGKVKVPLPAGGAKSTANDYLNFLVMILQRGTFEGKRILSENSIAAMQVNRTTSGVTIAYSPIEAGNFGYGFGEWIMGNQAVSSPGLFGSFPVVDYTKNYAAFLVTFTVKNEGRHERYKSLMATIGEAL